MRGISEERLKDIRNVCDPRDRYAIDLLIGECQELNSWQPIESAPKDREIVVFAPGYQDLNPIITICEWHELAGFCIDELRQPTLWMEVPK